jgi:predicted exporter
LTRRNLPALLWALIVCSLLAHNAYLWLKQRIVPDTDILALLPADRRDPVLQQAFVHMVDAAQQRLIVLIGAADWPQARRAADAYRDILGRRDDLFQLADQVGDRLESDWLVPFQRHRLALLTAHDEAALRNQPAKFWIDVAMVKLYSPFSGPKLGAWQDDPFGLFSAWVQARAQETPVRPRDGRLFVSDADGEYVVMPMTLRAPAFSIAAQQAMMPLLQQARQAAQSAVAQAEVLEAGVVLHAAAAGAQARREVSTIGIGSMTGIILLMWLTFRSLKPIVLILLPIAIGFCGALSVCSMLFDKIHLITLVFGASLIGVAQDYGVYFLCQRSAINEPFDSRQLLRRVLPALLLALVTTIIGYMGLVLTPFPGLRQMAVFSVVGLIFAWLTVVFWFPALLHATTVKTMPLANWYGGRLNRWPLLRRDRANLFAAGVFIVLVVFGGFRLSVQDDIRSLQNPPKNLLEDQIKVSKLLDLPTPVQFFLLRGATPEVLLQREEILKKRLDSLVDQKIITGYHAVSNWVPSQQLQASQRRLIETSLLSGNGALAALAAKIGEDRNWFAATRARLLMLAKPLTPEDFLQSPAGEPWRHLWLGKLNNGYASVIALRGVNKASLTALPQAVSGLDGVQWIDKVDEISALLGNYRYYMSWVVLLSYLAVYGLLYPRYRGASWRALAPTALASIVTLAILGIIGQGLQLFHILALMLLLGIGVDYGIFFQERRGNNDGAAWLAVALSALSTLLSFGLLGLSKTPALQAFGLTMAIGIGAVALLVPCFRRHRID